ncbi:hypothetical protein Dvina_25155 [Dactylosporangium vinaceum]|uniref:Lipoprotein n=1 Tax=Dactylosporangium vinaceum TaxID=53362 RepID=A0ABV5MDV8_9ACTN|nr:hypothetical protein [Dactylosporangium vinaceum]UAC01051.1 hypothetical protein Dvina_25155 [Dactylosporangium vinaceum]
MPRHTSFLAVLVLAGVGTSGCLGMPQPDPHPVRPTTTSSKAAPSPSPAPAKDDVVAALNRLAGAQFTYHVKSNLPADTKGTATGTVDATGGFDHAGKVFEETVTVAGTGTDDGTHHRIVVGTDSYVLTKENTKWVHLDLGRLKSQTLYGIDMEDPIGLVAFTGAVTEASAGGPHEYKGQFKPGAKYNFLPVGRPSIVAIYGGTAPFTVTTDDQGNITSLHIVLDVKDQTIDMTTTFAGHGQPLATKRPAKNKTAEASDIYYG